MRKPHWQYPVQLLRQQTRKAGDPVKLQSIKHTTLETYCSFGLKGKGLSCEVWAEAIHHHSAEHAFCNAFLSSESSRSWFPSSLLLLFCFSPSSLLLFFSLSVSHLTGIFLACLLGLDFFVSVVCLSSRPDAKVTDVQDGRGRPGHGEACAWIYQQALDIPMVLFISLKSHLCTGDFPAKPSQELRLKAKQSCVGFYTFQELLWNCSLR